MVRETPLEDCPAPGPEAVDVLIRQSIEEFFEAISTSGWYGREHEAVSLFAFGHLIPRCSKECFLRHPAQICIEGAVRQTTGANRKKHVNKDLLIWPRPGMNCWCDGELTHDPVCIMEWKVRRPNIRERGECPKDVKWLREFSKDAPRFVGYALGIDLIDGEYVLYCTRVHRGESEPGWLALVSSTEL